MTEFETFTEWREERLYVLRSLEDFKDELRRQAEAAAVLRDKLEEKAQKDIFQAHEKIRTMQTAEKETQKKIRALEDSNTGLGLKNWALTLALGGAGALAMELVKWWLGKK